VLSIDGDTFRCADGTRVQLLLIDTPERDQRPFGEAARSALVQLLAGSCTVQLEPDVEPRDQYGRTLAYVYLPDGRMVNEEMPRAGYARGAHLPPNVQHIEHIRAAVKEAQATKRGLWSTCAFDCSPYDRRRGRC